jgi:hypothetical protein
MSPHPWSLPACPRTAPVIQNMHYLSRCTTFCQYCLLWWSFSQSLSDVQSSFCRLPAVVPVLSPLSPQTHSTVCLQ